MGRNILVLQVVGKADLHAHNLKHQYVPSLASAAALASHTPLPCFVGEVKLNAYDLLRFDAYGAQQLLDLKKKMRTAEEAKAGVPKQEGHGDAGVEISVCNISPDGELLL